MQTDPPSIIENYADALIALGHADSVLDDLKRDLAAVMALLDDEIGLRRFLADPLIKTEGKQTAMLKLLRGKAHPILLHFLNILLEQERISQLPLIAEAFFSKVSELGDRLSGEIVSATELSDAKVADIAEEVGALLRKHVDLRVRIDKALLGGLIVRAGDFVIDGTIDHQLEAARQQLLAAPLPPTPTPTGQPEGEMPNISA